MRRLATQTRRTADEDTLADLLVPLRAMFGDAAGVAAFWREHFEKCVRISRESPTDAAASEQFIGDTLLALWRLEELARRRQDNQQREADRQERQARP